MQAARIAPDDLSWVGLLGCLGDGVSGYLPSMRSLHLHQRSEQIVALSHHGSAGISGILPLGDEERHAFEQGASFDGVAQFFAKKGHHFFLLIQYLIQYRL